VCARTHQHPDLIPVVVVCDAGTKLTKKRLCDVELRPSEQQNSRVLILTHIHLHFETVACKAAHAFPATHVQVNRRDRWRRGVQAVWEEEDMQHACADPYTRGVHYSLPA
jgi:hypothetical protein